MLSISQINKHKYKEEEKKNVDLIKRLYYRGPAPTIEPSLTTRAAARRLCVCVQQSPAVVSTLAAKELMFSLFNAFAVQKQIIEEESKQHGGKR